MEISRKTRENVLYSHWCQSGAVRRGLAVDHVVGRSSQSQIDTQSLQKAFNFNLQNFSEALSTTVSLWTH